MKTFRPLFYCLLAIFIISFIFVALPVSPVLADFGGPNNAGLGTNVPGIGSAVWVNPNNITVPVGLDPASVVLKKGNLVSNYLWATKYGFSIPLDATVTGIEVVINRQSSGNNPSILDNVVSLVTTDGIIGENKAYTTTWTTSMTAVTYGGPTDLWDTTTLTPTIINSDDFGVALSARRQNNGNSDRTASVDYMQIKVYYIFRASNTVECGASVAYGGTITCTATITRLGNEFTPTGTVTWSTDGSGTFDPSTCELVGSGASATCSTDYTATAVGDGTHLITGSYSGDSYFSPSHADDSVTVLPRPITVTADPKTKVFGALDPVLTYQITSGSLVFSDTITGTLARTPGESVGIYPILQGTLAVPATYNLTFAGANFSITKAAPTCVVTPYDAVFNTGAHIATGQCTGIGGVPLVGLDLSGTSHINAGNYPADVWTFHDETGNYSDASGTVADRISKANVICNVTPYKLPYDALAHTATGLCTGVFGQQVVGLDLSGTTHTKPGEYLDSWSFTDVNGNYNNANGTVTDIITGGIYWLPLIYK